MKKEPTKEERKAALNVLKYYFTISMDVADQMGEDERVYEYYEAIGKCIALLRKDPKETFEYYLEDYKAGH